MAASADDVCWASGTELAQMIQSQQVTAVGALQALLDRISNLNGDINAVVVLDADRALARAAQADEATAAGDSWGPLHGVPMTVKENNTVEGMDATIGDPLLVGKPSDHDEPFVEWLKEAGAIIFGKTNLPVATADWQSYNSVYGTCCNPWQLGRSPGGSSGGSAAALAAGFSPLEVGGDIGGSIRIPAAFCGVFGHKPTYGVVPKEGPMPSDLSVRGPMARCSEDLALLMELTAGGHKNHSLPIGTHEAWKLDLPKPTKSSLSEFRVAIIDTDPVCPAGSEVRAAAAAVGAALRKAGASVDAEAELPFDSEEMLTVYLKLLGATMLASPALTDEKAAATDEYYYGVRSQEVAARLAQEAALYEPADTSIDAAIARSPFLSFAEWKVADTRRHQLRRVWSSWLDPDAEGGYDVLICPIFAVPAYPHDHTRFGEPEDDDDVATYAFNPFWRDTGRHLMVDGEPTPYNRHVFWSALTGTCYLPSTVFPAGVGRESGMPIGLQVVGREGADFLTIDFCRLLEKDCGFVFQRPPTMTTDKAMPKL
jgi:amidase